METFDPNLLFELSKYLYPEDLVNLQEASRELSQIDIWERYLRYIYQKYLHDELVQEEWEEEFNIPPPPEELTLQPGHHWKDIAKYGILRTLPVNQVYQALKSKLKLLPTDPDQPFRLYQYHDLYGAEHLVIGKSPLDAIANDHDNILLGSVLGFIIREVPEFNEYGYILIPDIAERLSEDFSSFIRGIYIDVPSGMTPQLVDSRGKVYPLILRYEESRIE